MDIRTNAGYIITDSIHIGEYEYVLGVHSEISDKFVTWLYFNGGYCYGHYLSDLFAAEKDLVSRAQEQIKIIEDIKEKYDTRKSKKDKDRER